MAHKGICLSEAKARVWHDELCAEDATKEEIAALAAHFLATDEDASWCVCDGYVTEEGADHV